MKTVFVISGPSGSGKSTLINMLINDFSDISPTVSHTTRRMRSGEVDGKDYYFVNQERFAEMIQNGQFIEHVKCFGNFYGTSLMTVERSFEKNNLCIMDLNWEGAYNLLHDGNNNNVLSLKSDNLKKIGVLILPPSFKTLRDRLQKRNSETNESFESRLSESFVVEKIAKYDYVLINGNITESYNDLKEIYNIWK
ncbi:MAG: guanylate kinase [Holosporales bacterium]|jgi:guanylate kinase|nr:guanylate kinase [Holosporales bacterium]